MASPLKNLITGLRAQGVEIKPGGSHLKLMYRNRLVGILPSDLKTDNRSALRKTCAQLRRYGLAV